MPGTRTRKRPVHADYLDKDASETHVAFAAYIEETTGLAVDAGLVGLVQRLYPLYLKSDAVQKAKEEADRKRAEEAAAKKAAKERRLKERLARIEAQRQKLLADLGIGTDEEPEAEVIDAADRFTDEPEPETAEEPEDDAEPQAQNVTLTEDDDDLWDDEDDEEDF